MSDEKILPLGSPGAVLMAEFILVVTRARLIVWELADEEDEEEGFGADLEVGSDLAIGVYRKGQGFEARIDWNPDEEPMMQRTAAGGANIYMPESITAAIEEELYAEVDKAYHATRDPGERPI